MKKRMRNFLMIMGMGAVLFSAAALAEGSESVSGTEAVTEESTEAQESETSCVHSYEWKSNDTQYWKKCSTCGDETDKKDLPSISLSGADKVCRTQAYQCVVTVSGNGAYDGAEFDAELKGDIIWDVVQQSDGTHLLTLPPVAYVDTVDYVKVAAYAKTEDDFFVSAKKTVTILNEHSGGTATCMQKAVCDICDQSYGELDADHHTLEHRPAKEATAAEHGNTEYWYCTACGKYFSDQAGQNEICLEDTILDKLPEIESETETEPARETESETETEPVKETESEKETELKKETETEKKDTAPDKSDNEAPKTGDDSNIGRSLAFLFISGSLLITISRYGRKESMQ